MEYAKVDYMYKSILWDNDDDCGVCGGDGNSCSVCNDSSKCDVNGDCVDPQWTPCYEHVNVMIVILGILPMQMNA